MKLSVSTVFRTDEATMWEKLVQVATLQHVAAPWLVFEFRDPPEAPRAWAVDTPYRVSLSLFGVIPLGHHEIRIVEIDTDQKVLVSNEHGRLTKQWDHRITLEPIDQSHLRYTDQLEIRAGLLTLPVWLFAQLFYRHRQRRWAALLGPAQGL